MPPHRHQRHLPGHPNVVVLVDGSDARALEGLLGEEVRLGKLVQRRDLAPTIPRDQWRGPLRERFVRSKLSISSKQLAINCRVTESSQAPCPL